MTFRLEQTNSFGTYSSFAIQRRCKHRKRSFSHARGCGAEYYASSATCAPLRPVFFLRVTDRMCTKKGSSLRSCLDREWSSYADRLFRFSAEFHGLTQFLHSHCDRRAVTAATNRQLDVLIVWGASSFPPRAKRSSVNKRDELAHIDSHVRMSYFPDVLARSRRTDLPRRTGSSAVRRTVLPCVRSFCRSHTCVQVLHSQTVSSAIFRIAGASRNFSPAIRIRPTWPRKSATPTFTRSFSDRVIVGQLGRIRELRVRMRTSRERLRNMRSRTLSALLARTGLPQFRQRSDLHISVVTNQVVLPQPIPCTNLCDTQVNDRLVVRSYVLSPRGWLELQ